MTLTIGRKAPDFNLPNHLGGTTRLSSYLGQNVVLAFFPLAWTPVWTNQIPSYEVEKASFEGLNTQVLGISVDHVPCLKAWAESLGGISYPLLSDFWPHGAVCQQYGVLRPEGHSERALFVIDAEGVIRYIDIHDIDEQPDNEVLRQAIRAIDPAAAAKEPPYIEPEPVELPHGGIVMYCTPWCPDCKRARAWLQLHKLPYTEVNIPTTPGAAKKVREWADGLQITPTFDIDGQIIVDFDEEKLRAVLGIGR